MSVQFCQTVRRYQKTVLFIVTFRIKSHTICLFFSIAIRVYYYICCLFSFSKRNVCRSTASLDLYVTKVTCVTYNINSVSVINGTCAETPSCCGIGICPSSAPYWYKGLVNCFPFLLPCFWTSHFPYLPVQKKRLTRDKNSARIAIETTERFSTIRPPAHLP